MEINSEKDEKYMRLAIEEAKFALEADEVPIGAIIVAEGRIVGRGHNLVETLTDVTAHAELQAITAAASTIGGKYLNDCTLYVTVEPCPMCAGALAWSRVITGAVVGFSIVPGILELEYLLVFLVRHQALVKFIIQKLDP